MSAYELYAGDCLDMLAGIEANSIDACVTDPPYHLTSIVKRFGGANAKPVRVGDINATNDLKAAHARAAAAGFMGKQWDGGDIAFRPEVWAEVLRVLKPGAHLVAFGGTRTYHRMACAIEDAGFEIRDTIMWLYGSGFPKSHDVSKGIDKAARGFPQGGPDPTSLNHGKYKGGCSEDNPSGRGFGAGPGQFMKRGEGDRETLNAMGNGLKNRCVECGKPFFSGNPCTCPKPAGMTEDARKWEGWGTALKPACEPIVLARKPPSERNVAANVLRWGTGALNIDGCRVRFIDDGDAAESKGKNRHADFDSGPRDNAIYGTDHRPRGADGNYDPPGRWPANVLHDGSDEVVGAFPESESIGHYPASRGRGGIGNDGHAGQSDLDERHGDSGSAARFFYTAKADADDRLGSKHPTVKPLDLMQYLVRLVTPPKGLVLDPFAGTGPTGEAALREGKRAVLIEREEEYQHDIRRRMRLAMSGPDERAREAMKHKTKDKPLDHGPLFATKDAT